MRLVLLVWIAIAAAWGNVVSNGKSILLSVPSPSGILITPDKNLSVVAHPADKKKGMVIWGVDYYTPPAESNLTWIAPGQTLSFPITIEKEDYPIETLSVDPSKVTPPPEALERIEEERIEAEKIYARFTPIRYWEKPFIKPLDTFITSLYGAARTYNGTLQSYHGGVDFRARTPIPIQAANDGIVVLAKDRYYAGGTIILDHGEGIYSCYFHLSRYDVNVGDYVQRGQNIALSGATGRITGPHLHFGMVVHGVQSDPLDLIEKINALFNTPKELHETYSHQ
jgi:hypothetical protein